MAACKALLPPALSPDQVEPTPGTILQSPGPGDVASLLASPGVGPSPPTAQGAPAATLDSATIMADPGFFGTCKQELLSVTSLASLSGNMQVVFQEYFSKYDLNGSGIVDSGKELTQMCTNLAFALKLGAALPKLLEAVEAVGPEPSMDLTAFVEWFLGTCKQVGI